MANPEKSDPNPAPQSKGEWLKVDPDIKYGGKEIILPGEPASMPLSVAIQALQRKTEDEERVMTVMEFIDTFPTDGAVAFQEAMRQRYGWASPVPTPGFFGPKPPQMRSIVTGPNPEDIVQVPWGRFVLPGVEGNVNTGAHNQDDGSPQFIIYGDIKKKHHSVVKELAALTRAILAERSIYKGKAIRLRADDEGNINYNIDPSFLPTSHVVLSDLILNPGEAEQVQVALWTPIQRTADCIKHKIPLKRGVLLEGPYGCGKSMTATVTSRICVENGWTFILLDDVRALKDALLFAKRYSPAVVFAEDADRVAHVRDQRGNDLLNTIDGILSKDAQVITVLTTNHVEKLERAMLRPGRLDAVVSVRAPEAEAVKKLIAVYARSLLDPAADLSEVGKALAGNIPATIREVVERSKLAMIERGGDTLTADDLLVSASGMKRHLTLLEGKPAPQNADERLGAALREGLNPMANGMGDTIRSMAKEVTEILDIHR